MKPANPLKRGAVMVNSAGVGTVTRSMVRRRAVELAKRDGRSARQITETDWATARRELTGEPEIDPKEQMLEAVPEAERWDPVPGTPGRKAPTDPGEDEDPEGRSDQQRLVEAGVEEAESDRDKPAARRTPWGTRRRR